MKKEFVIAIASLILIILCGGCMRFGKTDDDIAKERFLEIVESIKKRDKKGLKEMFSDRALSEVNDIDNDIERLFEFFDGDMISWEISGPETEEHNEYGDREVKLTSLFDVKTAKGLYKIFIVEFTKNDKQLDNIGLYILGITMEKGKNAHWGYFNDIELPGIYVLD